MEPGVTAEELIEAAIANARHAAQVFKHAAMRCKHREQADILWRLGNRLERLVEHRGLENLSARGTALPARPSEQAGTERD